MHARVRQQTLGHRTPDHALLPVHRRLLFFIAKRCRGGGGGFRMARRLAPASLKHIQYGATIVLLYHASRRAPDLDVQDETLVFGMSPWWWQWQRSTVKTRPRDATGAPGHIALSKYLTRSPRQNCLALLSSRSAANSNNDARANPLLLHNVQRRQGGGLTFIHAGGLHGEVKSCNPCCRFRASRIIGI